MLATTRDTTTTTTASCAASRTTARPLARTLTRHSPESATECSLQGSKGHSPEHLLYRPINHSNTRTFRTDAFPLTPVFQRHGARLQKTGSPGPTQKNRASGRPDGQMQGRHGRDSESDEEAAHDPLGRPDHEELVVQRRRIVGIGEQ